MKPNPRTDQEGRNPSRIDRRLNDASRDRIPKGRCSLGLRDLSLFGEERGREGGGVFKGLSETSTKRHTND